MCEVKEVWPWHDEPTGYTIQDNQWYGFGDSGFIAAGPCERRQSAVLQAIRDGDYKVEHIGWLPEHLGSYAITVLTGRQYVDRLKEISKAGGSLFDYGHWS